MLGTDARCSFRELSVLQVCLWRDWTVLPTNSSDCLLGERFKVKMGLPEWYTNDAVAQYLVQWVIFPFFIGANWASGTFSQFAVADPGERTGEAPPIFRPNWGPKGQKKFFCRWVPPLPYLRVWMTAPPPYLKVWIRQWFDQLKIVCFTSEYQTMYLCSSGFK